MGERTRRSPIFARDLFRIEVVSSYRLVWAARVEPDELASRPALPAALRQDGPLAPGSTLVWRQGEQVRVQRALLQGEEQVPRAGLPGEQRALVGLPVLVPDERRALV